MWFHNFFYWLEEKIETRVPIIGKTLKDTRPLEHTVGEGLSHKQYVQEKLAEENKFKQL